MRNLHIHRLHPPRVHLILLLALLPTWHTEFQMQLLSYGDHHMVKRRFALASIARVEYCRVVPLFAPTLGIEGHLMLARGRYEHFLLTIFLYLIH